MAKRRRAGACRHSFVAACTMPRERSVCAPMLEELYLIRHATADRSAAVPYHTPPGPPLTTWGIQEATQTAVWLVGRQIAQVLTSPFARTRATADIIAGRLGLPVTPIEALRESAPGERMEQIQPRVAEL